jgi:transposase-like protein
MERFARPDEFCPNAACPDYGRLQAGQTRRNIKKAGKAKAGVQRYKCKTGQRSFTQTAGTTFYRKRTSEPQILETLAVLAEGSRISSLSRVKGFKS